MSYLAKRLLWCGPKFKGVLDTLAMIPAGAWSLRRLRGGYVGPCLNVRRDSDGATADIGFTVSGDLNLAGLLAFVGHGNGYVSALYDQMAGASHLTQNSAPLQPQIVAAGVVVNYPSWPNRAALQTNGGTSGANGSCMQSAIPAAALTFPQPFARSSVLAFPWGLTPSNNNPVVLNSGKDAYIELYQTSSGTLDTYAYDAVGNVGGAGFTSASGIAAGTTGVLLETINQAQSAAAFNSLVASGVVGKGAAQLMSLGGNLDGSARCSRGLYGEVIEFPGLLPANDQQLLMTDQCRYWQTPSPYRAVVLIDNPFAYWPLNESGGTVAADISGNGLNGTYQAGAQPGAGALLPGMVGAWVALSGASDSFVDVSAASAFCAGKTWSAECWANVGAYTVAGADGSHGTPWGTCNGARFLGNATWRGGAGVYSGVEWGIEAWNANSPCYNDIIFVQGGPGTVRANANTAPALGTTNHHVVTYNNGTYCLYLNGVLQISGTTAAAAVQAGLQIGTIGWTCGALSGVIGEIAVYKTALTAQQVANHYAAGVAARAASLDSLTT